MDVPLCHGRLGDDAAAADASAASAVLVDGDLGVLGGVGSGDGDGGVGVHGR